MNKRISLQDAVSKVKDGMTVMVGGFLAAGSPIAILDELAKSGVKDLTLICNDTAFADVAHGKLITNKQVKKVIVSHIGTNPNTSEQMNSGELEIELEETVNPQSPKATAPRGIRSSLCSDRRPIRSRRQAVLLINRITLIVRFSDRSVLPNMSMNYLYPSLRSILSFCLLIFSTAFTRSGVISSQRLWHCIDLEYIRPMQKLLCSQPLQCFSSACILFTKSVSSRTARPI